MNKAKMRTNTRRFTLAVALLALAGLLLVPSPVQAASVAVNSTTDVSDGNTTSITALIGSPGADGVISLREAMEAANNTPGADAIGFSIPTADPGYGNWTGTSDYWWKITLNTSLPKITEAATIDGFTQTNNVGDTNPGVVGTGGTVGVDRIPLPQYEKPEIEINANDMWQPAVLIGSGASNVTIRGLAIYNAIEYGDTITACAGAGGVDRVVEKCLVGLRADGSDPGSDRSTCHGIYCRSHAQLTIRECYVGYNSRCGICGYKDGSTIIVEYCETFENAWDSVKSYDGIDGNGPNNVIRYNLSYNNHGVDTYPSGSGGGIEAGSYYDTEDSNNLIENNTCYGNQYHGISVMKNPRGDTIRKNLVYDNGGPGILVTTRDKATNLHTITLNSLYDNDGLGIDLCTVGDYSNGDEVTFNNSIKDTSQANDGMDFPVITSANQNGNILTLVGFVGSAPNQSLFASSVVEFFISSYDGATNPNPEVSNDTPPYHGEGKTYLGNLTTDANGNFAGDIDVTGKGLFGGEWITATATDQNGNTSEFSQNMQVPPPPPAVGGEAYPVNKLAILAPWIGLALVIALGGGILVMRRRRAN